MDSLKDMLNEFCDWFVKGAGFTMGALCVVALIIRVVGWFS